MIRHLALVFVLAAAACGGKQAAPATTETTTQPSEPGAPHAGHEGGAMEHEGMPPEMTKFHDILRPLWHAEKGPKRMADTCAAIAELRSTADAVAKATPPTQANADTWTTGTRALVAAVTDLEAVCKANESAKFEAAFGKVHDAFHALMTAAGMKHEPGEHGEHKH
jgi:hypothetical protein